MTHHAVEAYEHVVAKKLDGCNGPPRRLKKHRGRYEEWMKPCLYRMVADGESVEHPPRR